MQTRQDELRDELVAILGAGRELSRETDAQLADAFLRYLEIAQEPDIAHLTPMDEPHQPHYSLAVAGGLWGAALMFLFCLLTVNRPDAAPFMVVSIVLLSLVYALTRGFLYLASHGWRLPSVHVTIAPPAGVLSGTSRGGKRPPRPASNTGRRRS